MKIKIGAVSVDQTLPLVQGSLFYGKTIPLEAHTPEDFQREVNTAHSGFSVERYHGKWVVHKDTEKQLFRAGDGSLRELSGNSLLDYVTASDIEGRVIDGFRGDTSLSEMVGSVLGGRITVNDDSGRKYYQETPIHQYLWPDDYKIYDLASDTRLVCETWYELSPQFVFDHAEFRIRAGAILSRGFTIITPFTDTMRSAIIRRANNKIEVICDGAVVLRSKADSTQFKILNNTDEKQLILGARISQEVDADVAGCLSFSFIAQSGQYDIVRDGRFVVSSTAANLLSVNGTTFAYTLADGVSYVVDLERDSSNGVDVYIYRGSDDDVFTGQITGSTALDSIFQCGNVTFGSIVSCPAQYAVQSLQYAHKAFPRTTDVTGFELDNDILTFETSRYDVFNPSASDEILKYLGVTAIVTGPGGKVLSERYSDPVVDCPSAVPRTKRVGDEGDVPDGYRYRVRAYDHVLGVYRDVPGRAVIDEF